MRFLFDLPYTLHYDHCYSKDMSYWIGDSSPPPQVYYIQILFHAMFFIANPAVQFMW